MKTAVFEPFASMPFSIDSYTEKQEFRKHMKKPGSKVAYLVFVLFFFVVVLFLSNVPVFPTGKETLENAGKNTETSSTSVNQNANGQRDPQSDENQPDPNDDFVGDGSGNVPMRWIPNQRVLIGAPPTIIDLEDSIGRFRHDGAFGPAEAFDRTKLKISILSDTKDSVVSTEIHEQKLILKWNAENTGNAEITIGLKYPKQPPVFLAFKAEAWRPNYLWMFAVVIGGLGIFLFGMKNMSEGVQMIAGAGLRRMIAIFTENRFLALGIGVLATMLVQSSSVTTVMVVGFINSQIMTLAQGISVIMGANIGTTATGWLLTLKIGEYGLPILGVSTFLYIFAKNDRLKYISMAVMGLGFLFFGLETMGSGFVRMVELPEFAIWLKSFSTTSYGGMWCCIIIGCILTMMVQASAATLGITISLASIGAIDFSTAAALVLGENIGTTITALFASIGTSTNAKRAAYFHALFNILGVCWVSTIFIPILLPFVTSVANVHHGHNVATGIALTHTLFNVTNAIIFLPFVRVFAKLLTRFVPEAKTQTQPKLSLTSLGLRHMESPTIAIERSRAEIVRMANGCWEIADWYRKVNENNFSDEKMIDEIFAQEQTLDSMQDEVIAFLADVLAKNHAPDVAVLARQQLRIADELETISDYFVAILKSNLKLRTSEL
ncbi:MAG: Na/Pi cotransporter family protein, partial [Thermoguttaceae bacterium]|nr:Na/Pi cotransporter family protein [Thermoguttaceae bacterium]